MLQINLLGKLSIQCDASAINLPLKAQELLGFLLLFPARAHMREALAARLWGESTTKQAKKYLRQTLWHLQSLLNHAPEADTEPLLLVEGDWVQVYLVMVVALSVLVIWRAFLMSTVNLRASTTLHDQVFRSVLRAPINLFFDTTPIGRIINRFSKDMDQVDLQLPDFLVSSEFVR